MNYAWTRGICVKGRQTWVQFCHAFGDWLGELVLVTLLLGTLADIVAVAIALLPTGRSFSVFVMLGDARIGEISARD